MSRDWRSELEAVLREEIPLTQAMDLRVLEAGPNKVVLSAPLEPNHNHKRTAFGGSLYSLAVLSGWGLLWLRMQQAGLKGHVVIAATEVQYLKPVLEDFTATAEAEESVLAVALELYRKKGKARVELNCKIGNSELPALDFKGLFALVK